MAITTPERVLLLGQLPQSKHTLVDETIPIMQEWLFSRLQNWFHADSYIADATISFSKNSDEDTILDSGSRFTNTDVDFADDMDIHVQRSRWNDGVYHADTVIAGVLTLSDSENLVTETAENVVIITRMKFPRALELPFIELVKWRVEKRPDASVKSKSLGGRSVTYGSDGDVPEGLMKQFRAWRKHTYSIYRG